MISLKKHVVTVIIVFTIVVTLCVGFLSAYTLYNSNIEATQHNQKQVLIQLKAEVERFIQRIEFNAEYIAKNYTSNNNMLRHISELNADISSVIILNNKGYIKDFFSKSNLNIYKGFDYSLKEYFKEIQNGKQNYWSDVVFSLIDEKQSITYSFRIDNENIGVIFIKLNSLSSFCERYMNSDGSFMIRILDTNGIIILNQDFPETVTQRFNVFQESVFTDLINTQEPYTMNKYYSMLQSDFQIGMYDKVEKTNWNIVIRQSHDSLLQTIKEILFQIILILSFFVVVALYFSMKMVKKLFYHIQKYSKNIEEISAGNYEIKIEPSFYSEFESFTKSFTTMQDEIEKREESLEESLESFKSLVNSTIEAIVIHKDSICIDVNDVAVELFGYDSKDEMIGKDFLSFVGESSKEEVRRNLKKETQPYEIEFLKKDNTTFITLSQGKFLDLFGLKVKVSTIIDITEIKQKDKLLFQQSKMASMGEMMANIAHQWRQPLSAISSSATGMKVQKEYASLDDVDLIKGLDNIIKSTHYLSKTIDDFRNFFKADKDKTVFDVAAVIDNVLSLLESSLKNNDINVDKQYKEEFLIVGYENELTQALMNIINNAKDAFYDKHNQFKCIEINITKRIGWVEISIKDNAGGIPKEILSSIFEPYFTTKHKQQGTGIGLYMTHQIVVAHLKGKITANNCSVKWKNQSFVGAEFIIELKTKE